MIKIGINGFGRIGRNIMRALYESDRLSQMQVVAINDVGSLEGNVHLLKYDTTHGRFPGTVDIDGSDMIINGHKVHMFSERDPSRLPWKDYGVDIVFECTGRFTDKESAMAHISQGAKKVLISAPAQNVDATVVYGVNDKQLKATDLVVSNASCTTNCLAPIAKVLNERLGIVAGLMTTIHAFTNDQMLVDGNHPDLRRARSATQSMIPTKTGAASALGLVIPELSGKLDGFAMRVPTINVSIVDLTFTAKRETSVKEVNDILKTASTDGTYPAGLLGYNNEQLVSVDFNHNPASAVFDATQTKVIGNVVKVLAWYDNEWGFSNRMLDVAHRMMTIE
jgi:glyceraldehyde 3-phosphate dehydrogenase